MIDDLLSARHPDASPLELGELKSRLPNSWKVRFSRWTESGKGVAVPDEEVEGAFVRRVEAGRVDWTRSIIPLAAIALIAGSGITLGVLAWNSQFREFASWNTVSAIAIVTMLLLALASRWIVVTNKITASFLRGDNFRLPFDQPVDADEWQRREAASDQLRKAWGLERQAMGEGDFEIALPSSLLHRQRLLQMYWERYANRRDLDDIAKRPLEGLIAKFSGTAYNASQIALARLDILSPLEQLARVALPTVAGLAILAAITYGAFLAFAHWKFELGALWMTLVLLPLVLTWAVIAFSAVATIAWALWVAVLAAAGRSTDDIEFGLPEYRVRVRTARGPWVTLLRTTRQVKATEAFNLVVRDIRHRQD